MKTIPYGRQSINDADIAAVRKVLESDWLTQGPSVSEFENELARLSGAKYAVAVNNGSTALHIAVLSLGLGPGKRLWTTPNTFVASAACALYCGADVDFVDIDPADGNLSIAALQAKLKHAEQDGTLPDVLIPVHYSGQPCDMAAIAKLSDTYGFAIIEDACHAVGATYRDHPVGNCSHSDMAVFSFHPVKVVTTGEGGAITTNSRVIWEKLTLLRTHGITRDAGLMDQEPDGPWYYQQVELGFNYRMTDMQAALGSSQLRRLDAFIDRRHEIAERYDRDLAELPITTLTRHADRKSALHLYPVSVNPGKTTKNRLEVFQSLKVQGIGVQVHYIPVHTQPVFRKLGFKAGDFPGSETFYENVLSIPMFPDLGPDDQSRVIASLTKALM